MADTRRTRRQRLALLLVCGLRTASGFAGLRPRTQTRLRPLSAPLRMRAEHGGIDGVRPRPVDALAAFDKALGLDGAQVSSELSPAGGSSLALANQWTREDVKSAWAAATESATQTVGISKPPRVKALFSDAGTLVLKVAPIRNESKLKLAAPGLFFSVAWLSIVADLTIKLLKSRSFFSVAFLLPFWYAGVTTGSYALEEGRRATSMQIIQIGEFEWLITEVEPQKRSTRNSSFLSGLNTFSLSLIKKITFITFIAPPAHARFPSQNSPFRPCRLPDSLFCPCRPRRRSGPGGTSHRSRDRRRE